MEWTEGKEVNVRGRENTSRCICILCDELNKNCTKNVKWTEVMRRTIQMLLNIKVLFHPYVPSKIWFGVCWRCNFNV